jgi:prepilin-type N-terminal cleavage/methylation domain-containing protein
MRASVHSGPDRRDSGFTLAELLVAMVLFGVVLGVSYVALGALTKAGEVAAQDATFARNITYPIDQFQKYLMQNQSIRYADAYRLEFWIDQHDNGTPDLVSFWVDSSGRFYKGIQQYNGTTPVGVAQTAVLSIDNANIAMGRPLFTYYTKYGDAPITNASTIPANADRVRIAIVAKYRTNTMESSGMVTFRNRIY